MTGHLQLLGAAVDVVLVLLKRLLNHLAFEGRHRLGKAELEVTHSFGKMLLLRSCVSSSKSGKLSAASSVCSMIAARSKSVTTNSRNYGNGRAVFAPPP